MVWQAIISPLHQRIGRYTPTISMYIHTHNAFIIHCILLWENRQEIPYWMEKIMVSGREYPLHRSNERGPWASPLTSTSSSLRSSCWCPFMATANVVGKCFPAASEHQQSLNCFFVGLIWLIGTIRADLGLFCSLLFDLRRWVGGSQVSFLWPLFEIFAKQIASICKAKTLSPLDVMLSSPTHTFHRSLWKSMTPGTSRWFWSEVGATASPGYMALPFHGQFPLTKRTICTCFQNLLYLVHVSCNPSYNWGK